MPDQPDQPPLPPIPIEIHWGDQVFEFDSEAEALKAGFHVPKTKEQA